MPESNDTGNNDTEKNGTEKNGTEKNGTEKNGTEKNGTEKNGTEKNGTGGNDTAGRTRPTGAGAERRIWAIRGATTVDEDTAEQVTERTQVLLRGMLERNGVSHDQIVSVFFTATDDIHSVFPATAARGIGFGDVPLICARELDIAGSQPRCVRVMMHVEMSPPGGQLHHVYLEGARGLRDDLPE